MDIGLQMNGAAAGIVPSNTGAPTTGLPPGTTRGAADVLMMVPFKDGTAGATTFSRIEGVADLSITGAPKDGTKGAAVGARVNGPADTPMTSPPDDGKTGAATGARIDGAVGALTTGLPKDGTGVTNAMSFTAGSSGEVCATVGARATTG